MSINKYKVNLIMSEDNEGEENGGGGPHVEHMVLNGFYFYQAEAVPAQPVQPDPAQPVQPVQPDPCPCPCVCTWLWLFMYLLVPVAICIPLVEPPDFDSTWLLFIFFPIFFGADLWFVCSDKSTRTKQECLDNIKSMQCLVSYYIPAAAVILAFPEGSALLRKVWDEDEPAIICLAIGVVASAISMVWIPIPKYETTTTPPGLSNELKITYFIVCFMEKVAIIFVLAGLFRIAQTMIIQDEDDDVMTLKCTMEEDLSLKCTSTKTW